MRTAERLVNLIAILCIISWRIFWITMLNRTDPTAPPNEAFTEIDQYLLDELVPDKSPNSANPSLAHYITKLARLGGYLARSHDPPPGNTVIWRGLSRLTDIELGIMIGAKLMVDTLLVDQETVYTPRPSKDRLPLELKGTHNEYELDLLRQRAYEARVEKAKRGDLVSHCPVCFVKDDGKLLKDPDLRIQRTIELVYAKFLELGSAPQVLLWFMENDLSIPARTILGYGALAAPGLLGIHQILTNPAFGGAYAYPARGKFPSLIVDAQAKPRHVSA